MREVKRGEEKRKQKGLGGRVSLLLALDWEVVHPRAGISHLEWLCCLLHNPVPEEELGFPPSRFLPMPLAKPYKSL